MIPRFHNYLLFQQLLERVHTEGVQVLKLSELDFLRRQGYHKEIDIATMRRAWEEEKQSMMAAMQALRDLLAQTHKVRDISKVELVIINHTEYKYMYVPLVLLTLIVQ